MKTFSDLVDAVGLIKAIIICFKEENYPLKGLVEKSELKIYPPIPAGVLEMLSFEDWMKISRDIDVSPASDLYKKAKEKAAELADNQDRRRDYLRHFSADNQAGREVLEKFIAEADYHGLLECRHYIPFNDPLVTTWTERLVWSVERSNDPVRWAAVYKSAKPKSEERKLALRKMCQAEGLPVNF